MIGSFSTLQPLNTVVMVLSYKVSSPDDSQPGGEETCFQMSLKDRIRVTPLACGRHRVTKQNVQRSPVVVHGKSVVYFKMLSDRFA